MPAYGGSPAKVTDAATIKWIVKQGFVEAYAERDTKTGRSADFTRLLDQLFDLKVPHYREYVLRKPKYQGPRLAGDSDKFGRFVVLFMQPAGAEIVKQWFRDRKTSPEAWDSSLEHLEVDAFCELLRPLSDPNWNGRFRADAWTASMEES